jgi:hypothetical protein
MMTAKFRKRPVEVYAFQWNGQAPSDWPEWARHRLDIRWEISNLQIDTLEGTHRADKGDWIIRGVKGEVYPCKPDIFELTYEPVE